MDGRGPAKAQARALQVRWAGRWHHAAPGRPFVIGRAPDAQLRIDHPDVSRHHVAVVPVGVEWELRDSSSNGTFVGGRRVRTLLLTGEVTAALGSGSAAPVVVIRAGGGPRPALPLAARPPASPEVRPRTKVLQAEG
ncbi:MAG: FHA domain-containing protein, partial [Pseudonocardia sp.]|nr:FHA domain-containing protein [Pseudonocardia sp.]